MNAHAQPLTKAPGADDLIGEIERLESLIAGWEESQRSVAFAYRRAIEALNKAALRKLIADVKAAPGAREALRAAAADPLVYAVLRHHGLVQPSLQERVEEALNSIRPMLASHGGNVELVAVLPPDTVEVRFLGNCDHCPSSTLTFIAGVRQAIEGHCPEIKHVRQVKGAGGGEAMVDLVSPIAAKDDGAWRFGAMLESVPDGGIISLTIDGEALILSRAGRRVACFRDFCAHLGLPVSGGTLSQGRIRCPHHGFEYDLMSGECLTVPEVQLRPVPVRLTEERIEVRLEAL
jgi:Fe-S cluster biogenesis protein NfuA/nitrite reductase/ring-hydroxylating ferredoxin subunit